MDAIADMLNGDMTDCGHAVGKGFRTVASDVSRDVTGGDGVFSHMGRKGARLGMGYDLAQQGRTVIMKLRPGGPWALAEKGAKPHTIPRATRGRGRRGVRYVYGPSYAHPVRGPIEHPGAPAKRAITRVWLQVGQRASRDFHEAYVTKLAKVMA